MRVSIILLYVFSFQGMYNHGSQQLSAPCSSKQCSALYNPFLYPGLLSIHTNTLGRLPAFFPLFIVVCPMGVKFSKHSFLILYLMIFRTKFLLYLPTSECIFRYLTVVFVFLCIFLCYHSSQIATFMYLFDSDGINF